jgi:hypothetical protein
MATFGLSRSSVMTDLLTPHDSTSALRLERVKLLARYDHGAMSPAAFVAVKHLETETAGASTPSFTNPRMSTDNSEVETGKETEHGRV